MILVALKYLGAFLRFRRTFTESMMFWQSRCAQVLAQFPILSVSQLVFFTQYTLKCKFNFAFMPRNTYFIYTHVYISSVTNRQL